MKTLRIDDHTHELITNKINEIKDQYGISITIESIVTSVLKSGIPKYKFTKNENSI